MHFIDRALSSFYARLGGRLPRAACGVSGHLGTGDSGLTWQAMAGLGYTYRWGEILGVWRYLDYDLESGSAFESVTFSGPAFGVTFRF